MSGSTAGERCGMEGQNDAFAGIEQFVESDSVGVVSGELEVRCFVAFFEYGHVGATEIVFSGFVEVFCEYFS